MPLFVNETFLQELSGEGGHGSVTGFPARDTARLILESYNEGSSICLGFRPGKCLNSDVIRKRGIGYCFKLKKKIQR